MVSSLKKFKLNQFLRILGHSSNQVRVLGLFRRLMRIFPHHDEVKVRQVLLGVL